MEYRPKHPQPFSLSDALKFDPATITEGSALTYSQILVDLLTTNQNYRP